MGYPVTSTPSSIREPAAHRQIVQKIKQYFFSTLRRDELNLEQKKKEKIHDLHKQCCPLRVHCKVCMPSQL